MHIHKHLNSLCIIPIYLVLEDGRTKSIDLKPKEKIEIDLDEGGGVIAKHLAME